MTHLSDFPPLMQRAMRTGVMPSHAEIAAATGKTVSEVKRFLGSAANEDETVDPTDAEPEDPEAERFRKRYQQLVAERCAEWLDENFMLDGRVPTSIRADIEYACNGQIQREWRAYRASLRADGEDDQ